jgi:hypothetical protein
MGLDVYVGPLSRYYAGRGGRRPRSTTRPLEESARFGLVVFSELAALAVQHRLPMKLDY